MMLGLVKASSPMMTAISSMRLLVVARSLPLRSTSAPVAGCRRMNPQPPGPGLPEQAPSVNSSTVERCGGVVGLAGSVPVITSE